MPNNISFQHIFCISCVSVIQIQNNIYLKLCTIASPAEQATREIEEGIDPTKTEIVQDTNVSISRAYDIIKSAKEQVLVICATSKTFVIGMNAGIIKLSHHSNLWLHQYLD
jgi:hypothetical protein